MSQTDLVKTFDYSICSVDEKGKLIYLAAEVGKIKGKGAELVIEMGKTLAQARGQLAKHHGGVFLKWIETECGLSKDTVYRSIASFEVFESCRNLRKLEVSAMYELAKKSTPEKAQREAVKLADKGEPITLSVAKRLIKKHAPKPEENGAAESTEPPSNGAQAAPAPPEPGTQATPAPPEPDPEPEPEPPKVEAPAPDPDSLEAVQADLREAEKVIRDAARFVRKVLRAEGNEITRPWCGCYSLLSITHPLQSVARTLLNDLPVGGTAKNPKLAREEAAEKA